MVETATAEMLAESAHAHRILAALTDDPCVYQVTCYQLVRGTYRAVVTYKQVAEKTQSGLDRLGFSRNRPRARTLSMQGNTLYGALQALYAEHRGEHETNNTD